MKVRSITIYILTGDSLFLREKRRINIHHNAQIRPIISLWREQSKFIFLHKFLNNIFHFLFYNWISME